MGQRFAGKTAIVIGAGQGIGRGVVMKLAGEGAAVFIADIDEQKAKETAQQVGSLARRTMAYRVNIANVVEIKKMVDIATLEFGRIDILVNAAGVIQNKSLFDLTEADWDYVVNVNQKGLAFCIQAVAIQMVKQIPEEVKAAGRSERSYGKIVNFSSISGRRGRPLQVHYAASKAAVISITQSAALALTPYNINVNAICPSVVPTTMWMDNVKQKADILGINASEASKSFIENIPLKRAGTINDMAAAVEFLCSSDSDYITGQTLNVDGGFEMN